MTSSVATRESTPVSAAVTTVFSPGILRLFLASMVIIHHASRLAIGGWAVNVFFMMSGYWVTVMYRKKYLCYQSPRAAFYLSRYLRLIPIYIVCQALMVGFLFWTHNSLASVINPTWIVRCLAIIGSGSQAVVLKPAWSLDVEAQFYLVLPLLILFLDRLSLAQASKWALALAALFVPLIFLSNGDKTPYLPIYATYFLLGIANAYRPWRPSRKTGILSFLGSWAVLAIVILLPAFRGLVLAGSHKYDPVLYQHNNQLCAVLTLIFVPYLCYSLSIRSNETDKHLGNLAYPTYLFHWIAQLAVMSGDLLVLPAWPARIMDLVVVAAGSLLLYFVVDQPSENFRARFIETRFAKRT